MESRADRVQERTPRGSRGAGIVVSILMVILGIMFFVWPIRTDYVVMVFASIGFIVYGVYQIMAYIKTPRDYKNGWLLASGIVFVILGIIVLCESPGNMLMTFAFMLGFMAMYYGVMQITSFAALKSGGAPGAGWVLCAGIINIILSICILCTPFAAVWALAYVLGVYLVVGGIALFAEVCSGAYGMKY